MSVVTMLSDFGLRDPYVSQMKGIILDLCPDSTIVDISHMVERHNIIEGAFLLEVAVPFFPKNSIHLAVVDPGVGTARLPVVIKSRDATLVGPDNGLLERAARRLGVTAVYKIAINRWRLGPVSNTFHGRDVFAKTAGKLAAGFPVEDVGPKVKELLKLELGEARINGMRLECRILHVDTFGNLITNAHNAMLERLTSQGHRQMVVKSARQTYKARLLKHIPRLAGEN
jgi:S-adenosyl-L-methionine hydrolase (adenosine-forming)